MPATLLQGWTSQNNGATAANDVAVTWGVGRTAGSLLVLCVNSDTTQGTPTGWTLDQSQINDSGLYIFFRISDNSATDSPTFTANFSTAIAYAEYSGNTASPSDVSTSGGSSTATNAGRSTGTTGTTAQADELAVACWGYSATVLQLPGGGNNFWSAQTNGFTEVIDVGTTKVAGTNVGICVAVKDLSSTGTVETTATPAATAALVAAIGTYKMTGGVGTVSYRSLLGVG